MDAHYDEHLVILIYLQPRSDRKNANLDTVAIFYLTIICQYNCPQHSLINYFLL